jgi:hypothetical protein
MSLEIVSCNQCGARLEVASSTRFVTCRACGAQLAVQRSGTATYTEPASPQGDPLARVSEHLGEISQQNELARIDREWELEREQYMVWGRYGQRWVTTRPMAVGVGLIGAVFGVFWTVMAFSITSQFPPGFGIGPAIFPFFGLVFIAAAVGMGIYWYSRAAQYEQAQARYQERRQKLLGPTGGHSASV